MTKAQPNRLGLVVKIGRGARIRTGGLVDPNDARYRAAPHPDIRSAPSGGGPHLPRARGYAILV